MLDGHLVAEVHGLSECLGIGHWLHLQTSRAVATLINPFQLCCHTREFDDGEQAMAEEMGLKVFRAG